MATLLKGKEVVEAVKNAHDMQLGGAVDVVNSGNKRYEIICVLNFPSAIMKVVSNNFFL